MTEPSSESSPAPSQSGPELGRVLARGVMWIGVFRWSGQIISWACTIIVLRLLKPTDYGVMGATTYFMGLATVVSEFGIATSVIAARELSLAAARQLNSAAALLGAACFAISIPAGLLLSGYFGEPAIARILPIIGSTFLIDALRTVPLALMAKRLEYRGAAFADFLKASLSAVVVLPLAALGFGYWALVGGIVGGSIVATTWILWRNPLGWAWPTRRDLLPQIRYSRDVLVGRLAWQGYANADFVVVGRMFGVAALGVYNVAWTIASLPGEKLTGIINAAAAPFFGSLRERPAALRHYFLRVTGILALLISPILLGFFLVADLAITLVLGSQWTGAVGPARALVFYAMIQSHAVILNALLLTTGRARAVMRVLVGGLLLLPAAFVVGGLLYGLTGVALAWTVTYPLLVAFWLRVALRDLHIAFIEYLMVFRPALAVTGCMALAVVLFRWLVGGMLAPPVELGASIGIGVVATGAATWMTARDQLAGLKNSLRPSSQESQA